jgi:hypothetical protein
MVFMPFLETYKQCPDKTRWLSMLASFLIPSILLFDISASIYVYSYRLPPELISDKDWQIDKAIFTFQGFVAVLFVVRFILLRLKKLESIPYPQIIWLVGWLSIAAYLLFIYSQCGRFSAVCGNYLSIPKSLLEVIIAGYFVFSPVLQIWKLLAALFPAKIGI